MFGLSKVFAAFQRLAAAVNEMAETFETANKRMMEQAGEDLALLEHSEDSKRRAKR